MTSLYRLLSLASGGLLASGGGLIAGHPAFGIPMTFVGGMIAGFIGSQADWYRREFNRLVRPRKPFPYSSSFHGHS